MLHATARTDAERGSRFVRQGFVILYHQGRENVCPGCGHRHWYVGRSTAQCAVCETALPLAESDATGQCVTFSGGPAAPRVTPRRTGRFVRPVRIRANG